MRNTVTFLDVCQSTSVFPWKSVRFLISWSIFHKLVGVTSWSQFDLWQPTVSNIPPERKYRRYPYLKIEISNEKIDDILITIRFCSLHYLEKNKQFFDKLLQISELTRDLIHNIPLVGSSKTTMSASKSKWHATFNLCFSEAVSFPTRSCCTWASPRSSIKALTLPIYPWRRKCKRRNKWM